MMGRQAPPQVSLFYVGFNLDERIREDHPLRKIDGIVDFEFTYREVRDRYGFNGNVSVAPPVILKLMLLLVLYNVRSERELMDTLPERLDWLWFLGYDLDSKIPNHSVLSKARRKWGVDAFKRFFERIVFQCVKAGLVDGRKIFMDTSFVDADASNNSLVDTHSLKRYLNKGYTELLKRLSESEEGEQARENRKSPMGRRFVSTTDPDAAMISKGKSKFRYKVHRAVDPASEIITSTLTTSGEIDDSHKMKSLMDSHSENTGVKAQTVVADSKYGTIENFLTCSDRGVRAHMPDLKKKQETSGQRKGIFPDKDFTYDQTKDAYICPAGKMLNHKRVLVNRRSVDYAASARDCAECELRIRCTRNKRGRTVKRHLRQEELDRMRAIAGSRLSKRDIMTRQHLMERSFARSVRYGFKRARWRGLWKAEIQEYITAAVQNIQVLIKYGNRPKAAIAMAAQSTVWSMDTPRRVITFVNSLFDRFFSVTFTPNPLSCRC